MVSSFFFHQSNNRFIPFCTFLLIAVGVVRGQHMGLVFSPKPQTYISTLKTHGRSSSSKKIFKESVFEQTLSPGHSSHLLCHLCRLPSELAGPANQEMQTYFLCLLGSSLIQSCLVSKREKERKRKGYLWMMFPNKPFCLWLGLWTCPIELNFMEYQV